MREIFQQADGRALVNTGLPGAHVYQVVALNENDNPLGASIPRTIVIQEFNSLPPRVNYNDPGFQSMTTFSKMKISAFGSDDDGTLVGVQFYMDGEPLGEEILRRRGVPQDFATFPVDLHILRLVFVQFLPLEEMIMTTMFLLIFSIYR